MQVTEIAMRPGEFRGQLSPVCPTPVRRELVEAIRLRDGAIVVHDTRMRVPSVSRARYVGWLTGRADDGGFSGHGWAGQLQSDDNIGRHITARSVETTQTLSQWIDLFLPYAGIVKGTINNTGLASPGGFWGVGLGAREFLDAACAEAGAHWQISPAGVLTAAAPDLLYPAASILVSSDVAVETGASVRGVKGRIVRYAVDGSGITSQVIGFGAGEGAKVLTVSGATTVEAHDLTGTPIVLRRVVNQPSRKTAPDLSIDVTRVKAQYRVPVETFAVDIDADGMIERFLRPGYPVWVHDSWLGVVGPSLVAGIAGTIRPKKVWCSAITWQTNPGQAVWLNRRGVWTDLTRWIEWGDGSATMVVSEDRDAAVPPGSPQRLESSPPRMIDGEAGVGKRPVRKRGGITIPTTSRNPWDPVPFRPVAPWRAPFEIGRDS